MAVDTLLATAAVHTDRAAWMVQQLQQSLVNHMVQAVIALVAMDTVMEAVQALIQQLLVRLLVQLVVAVSTFHGVNEHCFQYFSITFSLFQSHVIMCTEIDDFSLAENY